MKELIEEIKIYHSIEEIEKMINSITNSYLELNGENEFDISSDAFMLKHVPI